MGDRSASVGSTVEELSAKEGLPAPRPAPGSEPAEEDECSEEDKEPERECMGDSSWRLPPGARRPRVSPFRRIRPCRDEEEGPLAENAGLNRRGSSPRRRCRFLMFLTVRSEGHSREYTWVHTPPSRS